MKISMNLFRCGTGNNKKVLLDSSKGIDRITLQAKYGYTGLPTITKNANGTYSLYYSSGAGASDSLVDLEIPLGYRKLIIVATKEGNYCNLYKNVQSYNPQRVGGTQVSTNWGSETVVLEYTTEHICFVLGGWYESSTSNWARLNISYVALEK